MRIISFASVRVLCATKIHLGLSVRLVGGDCLSLESTKSRIGYQVGVI